MIIAYNDNEGLKIIYPAINININIIADKDIPSGLYYKIIQDSDLPPRETRSAWEMEINQFNSDGIGLTKEEFYTKYPEYIGWSVK
jgi:hypothetical protein